MKVLTMFVPARHAQADDGSPRKVKRNPDDNLILWPGHERHDVDGVAGKDREVRMVREQSRRGVDALGLDDDIAADVVRRVAYAVLAHAPGLADHAAVAKRRRVGF